MSELVCPFCRRDPFHYVDVGVGYAPAAIDCCDLGIGLYAGEKRAQRILRDMRSHHPHAKARAQRMRRAVESGE